jgi:glycerate dehydrogenase
MRKAVILDGYTLNPGDIDWTPLTKHADFTIYDRTTFSVKGEAKIIERAKDAEIIITNKTPLNESIMDKLPHLKYIGVLATGYDVVDIAAAKERNIVVTNIPSYGTDTVAQAAIALLLELCHHTGSHHHAVKRGEWAKRGDFSFWNHPIIELAGKTMGIIGFGNIGQVTARIGKALGMHVIAYNRTKEKVVQSKDASYRTLDEIYQESDVLMLHTPLTKENEGFINKESIAKMKDGVLLVNNARGGLINEADLADALHAGKVGGAAVDVVSKEPITEDNPLLAAKNCIITPHISWASKEARERLMQIAADNLEEFLKGNPINTVQD